MKSRLMLFATVSYNNPPEPTKIHEDRIATSVGTLTLFKQYRLVKDSDNKKETVEKVNSLFERCDRSR